METSCQLYTNDIDTLRQMISQSMPQFLNSIISIVSVFVSMLLLNIPLTLVTLVRWSVSSLFATKTNRQALSAKILYRSSRKIIATVNGYIEEMMNGQKVVKVFCPRRRKYRRFQPNSMTSCSHSADNANKFGQHFNAGQCAAR